MAVIDRRVGGRRVRRARRDRDAAGVRPRDPAGPVAAARRRDPAGDPARGAGRARHDHGPQLGAVGDLRVGRRRDRRRFPDQGPAARGQPAGAAAAQARSVAASAADPEQRRGHAGPAGSGLRGGADHEPEDRRDLDGHPHCPGASTRTARSPRRCSALSEARTTASADSSTPTTRRSRGARASAAGSSTKPVRRSRSTPCGRWFRARRSRSRSRHSSRLVSSRCSPASARSTAEVATAIG